MEELLQVCVAIYIPSCNSVSVHAVDIKCLGRGSVSEATFDAGKLESSSPLDNSLISASASGKDIALLFKHLPIKVSY